MRKDIIKEREEFSLAKINELKDELGKHSEIINFPGLTIFAAGSYARLEASAFSDIDLFFICDKNRDQIENFRTLEIKLFGKIIEISEKLGFPKFSNDCQYINILHHKEICDNLGSPTDDYENYFTARMLLFLESTCLIGQSTYDSIVTELVHNYFNDFPDHAVDFGPTFLLNDIHRYWKTMLLNYENKRKNSDSEAKKIKTKVRNFKLKYSRLMTCFSLIAAIGTLSKPVTEEIVIELIKKTPQQRLDYISENTHDLQAIIDDLKNDYRWFLEQTALETPNLEMLFANGNAKNMFKSANDYGNKMFNLLLEIDKRDSGSSLNEFLRKLVI